MQKNNKFLFLKPRRLAAAAAFACMLLAMYLFMSSRFQQSLLTSVNNQNTQFVEQVNVITSALQNMIQSCATQIYQSSAVKHVRTSAEHTNFEMIEAMREINKYEALYPFIDSIYLYNGKRGYIYFSSGNSFDCWSDYIHKFKDESAAALLMDLSPENKMVPFYRSTGGYSPYSQNTSVYSYMMFDAAGKETADNALLLNIPAIWFNGFLFGEVNLDQWVIGGEGNIIACPHWETPLTQEHKTALDHVHELSSSGQTSGYFIRGKGRDRQLYFYAQMGSTGWSYVRSIAYEDCMGALLESHRLIWTVFMFFLCLAGIAGVILFVKVLFPYRQLVTGIQQLDGVTRQEGDTDTMLEQLTTLASRSRDMERLNASFKEMLREETVRNILFGSQSKPFDAELAEQYGMKLLPDQPLFLMLISSIRLSRYLEYVHHFTPYAEGAVISAEYTVLLVQADKSLIPSICQHVSEGAPNRRILYTPICTDWSAIVTHYAMLRQAYLRRFLYDDIILSCEDILCGLDDLDAPLDDCIQEILQHLRKGFGSDARLKYMELVTELRKKNIQTVFMTLTHLFTDATQYLLRLNPAIQPDFASRRKQLDKLLSAPESMEEINAYFFSLFDEIAETGSIRQKEKRGSLISRIEEQIEEELANPELNSQSLADHFSLSSAYLSRIFRQETGISLTDYVNRKRIERAQELLRQHDICIKDVALQAGFSTEKYFYVVFRKITGVTPKQYRDETQAES